MNDRSEPGRGAFNRRFMLLGSAAALTAATFIPAGRAQTTAPVTATPAARPNVLVIMADDVGWFNINAYNMGIMGYRTPNIDRLAREGALFTDHGGGLSRGAGRRPTDARPGLLFQCSKGPGTRRARRRATTWRAAA